MVKRFMPGSFRCNPACLRSFFPIFAYFGKIFSHRFSHGIMGHRVKCFAEKALLFDIIVVFNYIVVQMDNLNT